MQKAESCMMLSLDFDWKTASLMSVMLLPGYDWEAFMDELAIRPGEGGPGLSCLRKTSTRAHDLNEHRGGRRRDSLRQEAMMDLVGGEVARGSGTRPPLDHYSVDRCPSALPAILGRDEKADVWLKDPWISHRHCEIHQAW